MMTGEQRINSIASTILPDTGNIEWNPDTVPPEGIKVENLRRRGIDLLRLQLADGKKPGFVGRLLGSGRNKKTGTTITIVDEQMRFDIADPKAAPAGAIVLTFADIKNIRVAPAGLSGKNAIKVFHKETSFDIGFGLSDTALHWLRERLLLERAGLVWKPLYNVGRRTTRKTCNPDDDIYSRWPDGPNRLVSFYLQEAPDKSRKLVEHIKQKNWEAAANEAHWLKASSAVVGASYLSELCQRIEIDLQTNDYSRVDVLAPNFMKEFNKVVEILSKLANQQAPEECQPSAGAVPAGEAPAEQLLKGFRILLVEDSKVNQEMARDSLDSTGCLLSVAENGASAVELHQKEVFDAILMDCQMPGMNGFEATKLIRSTEFVTMRPRVPIIALTANALRDDKEMCISAGMDDYVSKPYLPHEIIDCLLKWLPESAAAAASAQVEALKDAGAEMLAATAPEAAPAQPAGPPEAAVA